MAQINCMDKYCKTNESGVCTLNDIVIGYTGSCNSSRYSAEKSKECFRCGCHVKDESGNHRTYYVCSKGHSTNSKKGNLCWEPDKI